MDKEQKDIQLFMDAAGQSYPATPTIPDSATIELRLKLIYEEFLELVTACGYGFVDGQFYETVYGKVDLVEVADALTDINYVTKGAGIAFGIDLEPIFKLVQDSNMAKFESGGYRRSDGKWMKPPNWTKPDIAAELARQNIVVEMLPFDPKREYIVLHSSPLGKLNGDVKDFEIAMRESNARVLPGVGSYIVDTESPDFFANKKTYGVPCPIVDYTETEMARFRGEHHV